LSRETKITTAARTTSLKGPKRDTNLTGADRVGASSIDFLLINSTDRLMINGSDVLIITTDFSNTLKAR